jgi:hypothetical protein
MRRVFVIASLITITAAMALSAFQATNVERSLARFMPADAMLFIEAQDFGGLLKEWNSSAQKRAWLKSDNYGVFSRSRLFLKLSDAQDQFAKAAGVPPDMRLVSEAAGSQTALSIYDIGNLHMLYISKLASNSALQSGLWQRRGTFQTRKSATFDFYVRTDAETGRVAAFAVAGDYFILATREDLIAGALALLSGEKQRAIESEKWFTDSISAASAPGELRMVLNMEKVSVDPRFRTYWIQQNITEMQQYRAAICDLYRTNMEYREERVLLPKNPELPQVTGDSIRVVSELAGMVPPGTGFHYVTADPSPENVLTELKAKLLTRNRGAIVAERQYAPAVFLGSGISGAQTDLETRIDQAPAGPRASANPLDALQRVIAGAAVNGMLVMQSSEVAPDGVFVTTHATIALRSAQNWNSVEVRDALQTGIAPGLTTSTLGASWKPSKLGEIEYVALDGLVPLAFYVKGTLLIITDTPQTIASLANAARSAAANGATYVSRFNHAREREPYRRLMALMDSPHRRGSSLSDREPEFFSENVASMSDVLADVESESIVVRPVNGKVLQSVTYRWAK